MRRLELHKPLSALHVWAWVPFPLGTSQELAHSVEHRVFLDPSIASLEDPTVRHNGMTFWSGIRLEFTVEPSRADELRLAVERIFEKPLPKMTSEERERFARELEEGGGDFFDRAMDRFRRAFAETNGLEHSGKDEDALWKSIDPSDVRILSVGATPFDGKSFPPQGSWIPADRSEIVFPRLSEELPDPRSQSEDGEEEEYRGFLEQDGEMDYVMIFPSVVANARDYAFHALFFQHLRLKADAEFRDTGRTYDPVAEDYHEDGFVVSGIHLMTNDTKKRLPGMPKRPTEAEYLKTRGSLAFQNSIYLDQLLYGPFPVLGIPPDEAVRAIAEYPYGEFRDRFDAAIKRVSVFWGNSG